MELREEVAKILWFTSMEAQVKQKPNPELYDKLGKVAHRFWEAQADKAIPLIREAARAEAFKEVGEALKYILKVTISPSLRLEMNNLSVWLSKGELPIPLKSKEKK